jgi:hypothetical protein
MRRETERLLRSPAWVLWLGVVALFAADTAGVALMFGWWHW